MSWKHRDLKLNWFDRVEKNTILVKVADSIAKAYIIKDKTENKITFTSYLLNTGMTRSVNNYTQEKEQFNNLNLRLADEEDYHDLIEMMFGTYIWG